MKSAKQEYMKEIKKSFPMRGKREKKYLEQLYTIINNEIDDNATIFDCRDRFGQSNEIVADYYENVDFNYMKQQIHRRNVVHNCLVVLVIFVIAGFAIHQTISYRDYVKNYKSPCEDCYYEVEIGEPVLIEEYEK